MLATTKIILHDRQNTIVKSRNQYRKKKTLKFIVFCYTMNSNFYA